MGQKGQVGQVDVGIYGGQYPFPKSEEELYTGMPAIPQIIEMNMLNSVIPLDGTLNVQVKARIQE